MVAEAFLIVWRRFSEAPADENDARAWVFGIATYEQRTAANKPTARKTNRRRRTLILGGLAAAAGLLIMPALSGGDPAYATWTAEPAALSGSELDNAVSDCLNSKGDVGGMYSADLTTAEVAIAERRGGVGDCRPHRP